MARLKRKKAAESMELNLTSMMDVTFQLIIFFILVTNFVQLPELTAPKPIQSKAEEMGEIKKLVINILPRLNGKETTGFAETLVVGTKTLAFNTFQARQASLTELQAMLTYEATQYRERFDVELQVNLRADKSIIFEEIQPVMQAVTNARITHVNLVAQIDR